MFGKIALPCSPDRVDKAIRGYLECEQDVRHSTLAFLGPETDSFNDFGRVGRLLWAPLLSSVDTCIYNESVVPRHGPGATADKLRGNAKYNNLTWTSRLNEVFPYWENLIPSDHPSWLERMDALNILEPGDEIAVKVITVPKTLKTPRIIAVEPTCMQYMQQGILSVMMEQIPRFDHARNFVMFESQQPNQRLAREGSITGALATLDLSEASDRVSNEHVRLLLANHRELRRAVDATRSRKARVPGYGTHDPCEIELAKFASMGSALCFPFEALVFCTVIFIGIERALKQPLTEKIIRSFYGRVRVYGDDIIVPVEFVQSVTEALESYGFKVNVHKSFWTGKFRESCGAEFYDGTDVSIVRVRELLPSGRQHAGQIVSTVALRNHLFHGGYVKAVEFLDRTLERLIPFPEIGWDLEDGVPVQRTTVLGRHSYDPQSLADRIDPDHQVPLIKGAVAVPKLPDSFLDDYGALMKWFLSADKRSNHWLYPDVTDEDHLSRAGRPVSVRIKIQMARLF